ncbi:MAG TPA: hypothetical protein VKY34_03390 [Xanthomarina sp.]|nr:hypothetical protein [Xanthomarina sp.]
MCFLLAPTFSFAMEAETSYVLMLAEEEENNTHKKSNNVNEEEEKEITGYSFSNFKEYLRYNTFLVGNADFSNNSLKNHLVFKVPLPPPEQR